MPLFDNDNRLRLDRCNQDAIDRENEKKIRMQVENHRRSCRDDCDRIQRREFQTKNPNLVAWDGYGINACEIDVDSSYKNDPKTLTHGRCRQQLHNRTFVAIPQLYRGTILPGLESRIQNGEDTSKHCLDRLGEKMWDVFNPGLCSDWQDPNHIVQPWTWGGESSRDIARSPEFLETLGYVHDGNVWKRPGCS